MVHVLPILFVFALGACVGSFLNVLVYRLPQAQTLVQSFTLISYPASHCPRCKNSLRWYDNIPIFGWLKLKGRCRHCAQGISIRYPIVELVTALLFVLYYVLFFVYNIGPAGATLISPLTDLPIQPPALDWAHDWPIYFLDMFLISALLAASLIDAELFIIPSIIPWTVALVGIIVHAIIDDPTRAGTLWTTGVPAAIALGGGLGLIISIIMQATGVLATSFAEDLPLLDVERKAHEAAAAAAIARGETPEEIPDPFTRAQLTREMVKEIAFCAPPVLLAAAAGYLVHRLPGVAASFAELLHDQAWLTGALGAILGALIGGAVVWITRILGTLGFGREAMGIGDVHLMFGVGAVLGAGATTVAFFIAPFFGIAVAVYFLLTRSQRELPYGPYLSLAAAFVVLWYPPIAHYLAGGVEGLTFFFNP